MAKLHPNIGNSANPAAGGIGALTSKDFTIILSDEAVRLSLHRWGDETAAGDASPKYDHNGMINGLYTFRGIMVEGAIGIANLVDRDKNPVTGVEYLLSSGRKQTVNLLIIDVSWRRSHTGHNVPITFTCFMTSTSPASIEGEVS